MSRDFDGLEQLSMSERNRRIRDMGKAYAYGWRREEGGWVRWVVPVKDNKSLVDNSSEHA